MLMHGLIGARHRERSAKLLPRLAYSALRRRYANLYTAWTKLYTFTVLQRPAAGSNDGLIVFISIINNLTRLRI